MATRNIDIIVEHLRSSYYEANLQSLHRLDFRSMRFLLLFHDNLRIVCERLIQAAKTVEELDKIPDEGLGNPPLVQRTQLDAELKKISAEIAWLLEDAILHGWHALQQLDPAGALRKEYSTSALSHPYEDNLAWIGTAEEIARRYEQQNKPQDDKH